MNGLGKRGLPLAGMRVVDFSWAVAGPVTTKLLALFGAEVIKIESRVRIDGGRLGTPFLEGKPGINKSGYFANHNTSKRSIRLDLSKPEAKEIAKRLAAVADVVAESFSAGVIERQGLGYEELCKVKADLVMISLTMQGQTGPFASHVGFGRTLAGLAGFDHLTGWPASNPAGPNQPYTDLVVPWFAASAVVSALRRRDRTGQGQYLDLSQLEAALHFLAPSLLDYTANGNVQERAGNRVPGAAPHGVFPCAGDDRWVAVAVNCDAEWRSLCAAMGQESLADDPRFATLLARKEHEDALEAIVAAWTEPSNGGDRRGPPHRRRGGRGRRRPRRRPAPRPPAHRARPPPRPGAPHHGREDAHRALVPLLGHAARPPPRPALRRARGRSLRRATRHVPQRDRTPPRGRHRRLTFRSGLSLSGDLCATRPRAQTWVGPEGLASSPHGRRLR